MLIDDGYDYTGRSMPALNAAYVYRVDVPVAPRHATATLARHCQG